MYVYQKRIKGITRGYRTYAYGKEDSRAAIIIPNDTLDAIMFTQCSDIDMVLSEIKTGQEAFYAASAYMDYNYTIGKSITNIEKTMELTKGVKIIMAIDSNSRSIIWHYVTTNVRGRLLEEFIASNQIQIINEESGSTIFHSSRGQTT